jgi:hypothetical protein
MNWIAFALGMIITIAVLNWQSIKYAMIGYADWLNTLIREWRRK